MGVCAALTAGCFQEPDTAPSSTGGSTENGTEAATTTESSEAVEGSGTTSEPAQTSGGTQAADSTGVDTIEPEPPITTGTSTGDAIFLYPMTCTDAVWEGPGQAPVPFTEQRFGP